MWQRLWLTTRRYRASRGVGWLLALAIVVTAGACGTSSVSTSRPSQAARTATAGAALSTSVTPARSSNLVDATFVRVVDGDTIIVRLGSSDERVRLIGINTPELNKPDGPVECFATEASEQTEALLDATHDQIQLERDVSETDQYGRLLRYVWLVTPHGKQLLNEELVAGGYARSITYRPDVKYQPALNRDQTDARRQRRGLWGACE